MANPSRDLSGVAKHFKLACTIADCSTLNYEGSCSDIEVTGNISYAFNSYYQITNQNSQSCSFDVLGMITSLDPSIGECRFLVNVTEYSKSIGCG